MSVPAHRLTTPSRSFYKRPDESASLLGQLLHDWEPVEFDIIDMDCIVWKSTRKCLRYFEEKLPGEKVSPAQHRNLWMLALAIRLMRAAGLLSDGGVWLVWAPGGSVDEMDQRTSRFRVSRVTCDSYRTKIGDESIGTWETFRPLFTGEEWAS